MSHIRVTTSSSPIRAWPTGELRTIANVADSALTILVYSDNPNTRDQVRTALGRRIHPDLPDLTYLDVATAPVVVSSVDAGGIDLAILDGEATPAGGMGLAKQLKDEVANCPPIVVLTGRADDAWLASWSRAEAAVPHPIDPIRLGEAVVAVLSPQR